MPLIKDDESPIMDEPYKIVVDPIVFDPLLIPDAAVVNCDSTLDDPNEVCAAAVVDPIVFDPLLTPDAAVVDCDSTLDDPIVLDELYTSVLPIFVDVPIVEDPTELNSVFADDPIVLDELYISVLPLVDDEPITVDVSPVLTVSLELGTEFSVDEPLKMELYSILIKSYLPMHFLIYYYE